MGPRRKGVELPAELAWEDSHRCCPYLRTSVVAAHRTRWRGLAGPVAYTCRRDNLLPEQDHVPSSSQEEAFRRD